LFALTSSAVLCAVCYLGTCFIENPVISLLTCAITGITVSYKIPIVPEDEDEELVYPDAEVSISTQYTYVLERVTLTK
jgi:hypothetical protein